MPNGSYDAFGLMANALLVVAYNCRDAWQGLSEIYSTQQKGLILFDLITLNTTNLPIVIFVQKIKKSPIKRRFLYHKSNTNTKLTFE